MKLLGFLIEITSGRMPVFRKYKVAPRLGTEALRRRLREQVETALSGLGLPSSNASDGQG